MNANKNAKQNADVDRHQDTSEAVSADAKPAPGFARLLACEHGGIAMEYILLNITIMVVLVTGGLALVNPPGSFAGDVGDYGLFGQAFIDWYQRIVIGISLPIP